MPMNQDATRIKLIHLLWLIESFVHSIHEFMMKYVSKDEVKLPITGLKNIQRIIKKYTEFQK